MNLTDVIAIVIIVGLVASVAIPKLKELVVKKPAGTQGPLDIHQRLDHWLALRSTQQIKNSPEAVAAMEQIKNVLIVWEE